MNNTLVESGESEAETYLINIQFNTRPPAPIRYSNIFNEGDVSIFNI